MAISEKRRKHLIRLAKMRKGKKHSEETKKKIRKRALLRFSDPKNHPRWKGGKVKIGGYIYVYSPNHPHKTKDNYVCEHRLVMEESMGRFLAPQEVVHHKDGNRENNSLENLVLCVSNGRHTIDHHVDRDPETGKFVSS